MMFVFSFCAASSFRFNHDVDAVASKGGFDHLQALALRRAVQTRRLQYRGTGGELQQPRFHFGCVARVKPCRQAHVCRYAVQREGLADRTAALHQSFGKLGETFASEKMGRGRNRQSAGFAHHSCAPYRGRGIEFERRRIGRCGDRRFQNGVFRRQTDGREVGAKGNAFADAIGNALARNERPASLFDRNQAAVGQKAKRLAHSMSVYCVFRRHVGSGGQGIARPVFSLLDRQGEVFGDLLPQRLAAVVG